MSHTFEIDGIKDPKYFPFSWLSIVKLLLKYDKFSSERGHLALAL